MHRLFTFIFLLLSLSVPFSSFGRPQIINGSFEDIGPILWPGLGTISSWSGFGNVGINPVPLWPSGIAGMEPAIYANNGKIPHGTNVAYLSSSTLRDYPSTLTQRISGFEAGKKYVIRFFHNGGNKTGTYAGVYYTVQLGSTKIINRAYLNTGNNYWAVEGEQQFTKPYPLRITPEWTAPADGSYDLIFSMESSYVNDFPTKDSPPDQKVLRGGAAYAIDQVSIIEIGDLDFKEVRRNYTNHTEIRTVFSKPILEENATNIANFRIPGASVQNARFIPPDTVLLTTAEPLLDGSTLSVVDILDTQGRGMSFTQSPEPINVSMRVPIDFSSSTSGYEDDFNGGIRNNVWMVSGAAGDVYKPNFGLLLVQPAVGKHNFLLWSATDYDRKNHEVLMRVRYTQMLPDAPAGGAAVAVSPMTAEGVTAMGGTERFQLSGKGLTGGPDRIAPLQLRSWYWIRVRHQSVSPADAADVRAKIWLSDGETSEPSELDWNYAPTAALREGFAGIAAGEDSSSSFEVDYILIKSENAPSLTPSYPAELALMLSIEQKADDLKIQWRTRTDYALYAADDLVMPLWDPAGVEVVEEEGISTALVPITMGQRFFKLIGP